MANELKRRISIEKAQCIFEQIGKLINFSNKFVEKINSELATKFHIDGYDNIRKRRENQDKLVEQFNAYSIVLYTWRRIISENQIEKPTDFNRAKYYETVFEILRPFEEKLIDFQKCFLKNLTNTLCVDFLKDLIVLKSTKEFISDEYLLDLAGFLNIFSVLHELKTVKDSFTNDHGQYKAAYFHHFKSFDADSESLTDFLSTSDAIRDCLQSALKDRSYLLEGYESVLWDVINVSIKMIQNDMFLFIEEKYRYINVISFVLSLFDEKTVNKFKIDIENIQSQLIPIYGDMVIEPFQFNSNHKKASLIKNLFDYDTIKHIYDSLDGVRKEYRSFTARLEMYNCYRLETVQNQIDSKSMYDLALEGLKLLTKWKHILMSEYYRKLTNSVEHYEFAVKYNFSSNDKIAFIEIISMIKDVQKVMRHFEAPFQIAIRQATYFELKHFEKISLKNFKFKRENCSLEHKTLIQSTLNAIRVICMNLYDANGTSHNEEDSTVLCTQICMIRKLLELLISDKTFCLNNNNRRQTNIRKKIAADSIVKIEEFYRDTFFWPYLFTFTKSLQKCGDLSHLWYRETFLERSPRLVQYPIEMSLPWILIEYMINEGDEDMMKYVLYPFCVYNDAGDFALSVFKKRHLYDECEAEVKLCLKKLIEILSKKIFVGFKQAAASILYKSIHEERHSDKCFSQNLYLYDELMKQREFQLLNRTVNLAQLIAHQINLLVKYDLNCAISFYEDSGFYAIIELDMLARLIRLTHRLLSKNLKLETFDILLEEVNFKPIPTDGRIARHSVFELINDIIPNYCYNTQTNRFFEPERRLNSVKQRSESYNQQQSDLWGSKEIQRAFGKLFKPYNSHISEKHFICMKKYLGIRGITLVIANIVQSIQSNIQNELVRQLNDLNTKIPKAKLSLPRMDYGTKCVFSYYYENLSVLIKGTNLHQTIFPVLNQIGNAIILCNLIEQAVFLDEVKDLQHLPLILNCFKKSKSYYKTDEDETQAYECEMLICRDETIFKFVLEKVLKVLNGQKRWGSNNGLTEFHTIWSALQFILCLPIQQQNLKIETVFGDGLLWSGCTLLVLLQQQTHFESFDFSYHLLNSNRVDGPNDAIENGISIKDFICLARKNQILIEKIFLMLHEYCGSDRVFKSLILQPTLEQSQDSAELCEYYDEF